HVGADRERGFIVGYVDRNRNVVAIVVDELLLCDGAIAAAVVSEEEVACRGKQRRCARGAIFVVSHFKLQSSLRWLDRGRSHQLRLRSLYKVSYRSPWTPSRTPTRPQGVSVYYRPSPRTDQALL